MNAPVGSPFFLSLPAVEYLSLSLPFFSPFLCLHSPFACVYHTNHTILYRTTCMRLICPKIQHPGIHYYWSTGRQSILFTNNTNISSPNFDRCLYTSLASSAASTSPFTIIGNVGLPPANTLSRSSDGFLLFCSVSQLCL